MGKVRNEYRRLLVEGSDDKRVIPELLERNGVDWGAKGSEVISIEEMGSIEEMLKPRSIEVELKTPGLLALGLVADANADHLARWRRFKGRLEPLFGQMPDDPPVEGFVAVQGEHRIGIWLMPDNRGAGMMETFLGRLVPETGQDLFDFAEESCAAASRKGARFRPVHKDKAKLHTWLAWQDPPGRQLHEAVKHHVLSHTSHEAQRFVEWFRKLYSL